MALRRLIPAIIVLLGLAISVAAAGQAKLRVAYAGSMGAVMDQGLGPAFAQKHDLTYQGIGQGSYGLAHLLAAGQMRADVFVAITPGPLKILQRAHLLGTAYPVAGTQMVIAYSPKSRYAEAFRKAAKGEKQWFKVLEKPGLRFGRTDPATDPQGRNIIFTLRLAVRYYHRPKLAKKILGSVDNKKQIFTEASLLSRLKAGQIDAASGYLSAVVSQNLPYIKLPDEINQADPAKAKPWYSKASFRLTQPDGKTMRVKPKPLVFYAGVLKNAAHPKAAHAFMKYLRSGAGRKLFRRFGYGPPKGDKLPAAR